MSIKLNQVKRKDLFSHSSTRACCKMKILQRALLSVEKSAGMPILLKTFQQKQILVTAVRRPQK